MPMVGGFASDGSDFVAMVGNFVSDGRRFAPGLEWLGECDGKI